MMLTCLDKLAIRVPMIADTIFLFWSVQLVSIGVSILLYSFLCITSDVID